MMDLFKKFKETPILIIALVVAGLIAISAVSNLASKSDMQPTVAIGEHTYNVEISDELSEQELGLSDRPLLDEDRGMIFVYKEEVTPRFWMKDMNFNLDIIWIDSGKKVIGIAEDVTPESYPDTFSPPSPIKYVLEINGGQSTEYGFKVGDSVDIDLN